MVWEDLCVLNPITDDDQILDLRKRLIDPSCQAIQARFRASVTSESAFVSI